MLARIRKKSHTRMPRAALPCSATLLASCCSLALDSLDSLPAESSRSENGECARSKTSGRCARVHRMIAETVAMRPMYRKTQQNTARRGLGRISITDWHRAYPWRYVDNHATRKYVTTWAGMHTRSAQTHMLYDEHQVYDVRNRTGYSARGILVDTERLRASYAT